jgi:para-nitrobenzyl esterase
VWDALRTDAFMRIPNLRVADARAARGAPTFVYRFDWEAPRIGAAHAVDLPFTFGTFDREGWAAAVGYDDRADDLSRSIRRSWTTFAGTGAPDPGIEWAPWDDMHQPTLLLGADGPRLAGDPDGATRACWST